eukprot:685493-Prorocentrum_minimum.AAC.4
MEPPIRGRRVPLPRILVTPTTPTLRQGSRAAAPTAPPPLPKHVPACPTRSYPPTPRLAPAQTPPADLSAYRVRAGGGSRGD